MPVDDGPELLLYYLLIGCYADLPTPDFILSLVRFFYIFSDGEPMKKLVIAESSGFLPVSNVCFIYTASVVSRVLKGPLVSGIRPERTPSPDISKSDLVTSLCR